MLTVVRARIDTRSPVLGLRPDRQGLRPCPVIDAARLHAAAGRGRAAPRHGVATGLHHARRRSGVEPADQFAPDSSPEPRFVSRADLAQLELEEELGAATRALGATMKQRGRNDGGLSGPATTRRARAPR